MSSVQDVGVGLVTWAITTGVTETWRRAKRTYLHRRFKSVFGKSRSQRYLAYGDLHLHPALESIFIPADQKAFRKLYPYTRDPASQIAISASRVGSGCEIQASSYVSGALAIAGLKFSVVTDEEVREKSDIDVILFGMKSNVKSQQIFDDSANCFAVFDESRTVFVRRTTQREILHQVRQGFDYGVILKIHPTEFPSRTWISCAGYGELGTSAIAWFLAHKWEEIADRIKTEDDSFVAVVEVNTKIGDESAFISLFEPLSGTVGTGPLSLR